MGPQIVERLDFVAKRIPGLKLLSIPNDHTCYLAYETYFVEVKLDQSMQSVTDVVVKHEASPVSAPCPILREVLMAQDFETFARHLSGLHSIYSINSSDKKVKQRAYPTLTALETDLCTLYEHQRRLVGNCSDLVYKSPLGIMEPRRGGFPVKLTYFITPYDLIDTSQKRLVELTVNNIIEKNLGLSVTVEIEGSSYQHKLQNRSLISTQHNSSLPQYAPFSSQNSEKLPAQFVLKLSQPFPMLNSSVRQIINEISEPATIKEFLSSITANSNESLINLIARQELDLNKGPFCRSFDSIKASGDSSDPLKHMYSVKLLEQNHTYHILNHYLERQDGVYLTKIPFTHPTSIPTILKVLRQQALFNTVIGSCIRRNKNNQSNGNANDQSNVMSSSGSQLPGLSSGGNINNDNITDENSSIDNNQEATHIFDVIPVNINSVCVSFEHPSKESLATLEIDLKELSCQLYALDKESVCTNDYATKVFHKCWSIPVTLRSVLRECNERRLALLEDANKRREKELQELLTSNSNQQLGLQFNSSQPYQKTTLQSKFNNLNEKSHARDLNSIAEFLSSKLNQSAAASSTSHQNNIAVSTDANTETDDRSNLLKKFSCKPKVKQTNPTAKNQTGNNKILSLMLKRQNSSSSASDDASLKATIAKKAKTKTTPETGNKNFTPGLSTTKLITPEMANAARLLSKQGKQHNSAGPNVSISLMRSPNKSHLIQPPSLNNIAVGLSLTNNSKHPDSAMTGFNHISPISVKLKSQANGVTANSAIANNNNNNINIPGKPRKSSIGAVIDRIVGGLHPPTEQSAIANSQLSSDNQQDSASKSVASIGQRAKTRPPGGDQFAIKQGSPGGLKLTVTKTKPTGPTPSNRTAPTAFLASTSSQPNTTPSVSSDSPSTSSDPSAPASSSTSATPVPSKQTIDASKLIGLSSSTPSIKYTIPKISKTQQASQSSQGPAPDNPNSNSSGTDSSSQCDESSNPSSSANSSTAASSSNPSSNTKRTSSTPFGPRPNNSNRSSVSSSTHPLGRTTSNPLAPLGNRPSSTSNKDGDGHAMNRISSTNHNQRQAIANRLVNVQQPQSNGQRLLPTNLIQPTQQQPPTTHTPLFALGLSQPSAFTNNTDINILAANQAALLNQQRSQQLQLQQQGLKLPGQSVPMTMSPLTPFVISPSVEVGLISSSKPQFATTLSQPMGALPQLNNLVPASSTALANVIDAQQRASTSVINAPPQFYVRQPMFDENPAPTTDAVSSTLRNIMNEVTQSSIPMIVKPGDSATANVGQGPAMGTQPILNFQARPLSDATQSKVNTDTSSSSQMLTNTVRVNQADSARVQGGVSSSSDSKNDIGPTISTPSSPTECAQVEAIQPPPLIPLDSLEEPRAASPELPDDASDRLSIVDINESAADSISTVGTPKPSGVKSPSNTLADSAIPSS